MNCSIVKTTEQLAVEKIMVRLANLAAYAKTPEQVRRVQQLIFERQASDQQLALIEQRLGIAIVPITEVLHDSSH